MFLNYLIIFIYLSIIKKLYKNPMIIVILMLFLFSENWLWTIINFHYKITMNNLITKLKISVQGNFVCLRGVVGWEETWYLWRRRWSSIERRRQWWTRWPRPIWYLQHVLPWWRWKWVKVFFYRNLKSVLKNLKD